MHCTALILGPLFLCRCESIRKCVEDLFGIMKKRHKALRLPMLLETEHAITLKFKVCAVLHSWLLDHDGLADVGLMESDWKRSDACDVAALDHRLRMMTTFRDVTDDHGRPLTMIADLDTSRVGELDPGDVEEEHEEEFELLREEMIEHFGVMRDARDLPWMKTRFERAMHDE